METLEFKVLTLKKRVFVGDALKGIMALISISKKLKFELNFKYIEEYLLDIDRINSFKNIDELYEDIFKTFMPTREMYNKTKIKSYINKQISDIIDISLSNQTISCNFLEYIYSYFFDEFLAEFIESDFSMEKKVEVVFDIPVDNIDAIYTNYEKLDIDDKIEKFKYEMQIFSLYNHIATLTEDSFVIINLDEENDEFEETSEQVLMIEFVVINKIPQIK